MPESRTPHPDDVPRRTVATTATLCQSTAAILESAGTGPSPRGTGGRTLWAGLGRSYRRQPAVELLRIGEAHRGLPPLGASGRRIVAIIDNGIDTRHPFLRDALIGAYDVRSRPAGGSPQAGPVPRPTVRLQQSTAAILEGRRLPAAAGHATMVAGIIRLVAPGARLLALQAFDDHGRGEAADVARAIRLAVAAGADVLNLSFRLAGPAPEVDDALRQARRRGAISVAAAGNGGTRLTGDDPLGAATLRVAATGSDDRLSPFSGFGDGVALAAPGEEVVTTWPGGRFARATGTSFSAPFVSGAAALLAGRGLAPEGVARALGTGIRPLAGPEDAVERGRLDVAAALDAATLPLH